MPSAFDVFISYNSKDRPLVKRLVRKLENQRVRVWYDEDQVRPGMPMVPLLEQGLEQSRTLAVIIGRQGFGPYHLAEREVASLLSIEQGRPCVPVILPDTPPDVVAKLPLFLRRTGYVYFEGDLDHAEAWRKLMWGITGELARPRKRAKGPKQHERRTATSTHDEMILAVEKLERAVRASRSLTFVLGARSSFGGRELSPCFSEVSRGLLLDLKLIDDSPTRHRFLPSLDTVASLYSVERGIDGLEQRIARLMASGECHSTTLHETLANLIGGIQRSRLLTRKIRAAPEPQLIASTSIDIACERALLRAGVSFTRIVQHRSGLALTLNTYRGVRRDGNSIRLTGDDGQEVVISGDDHEALDDLIATSSPRRIDASADPTKASDVHPIADLLLTGLPDPYLYKYHGSQDVRDSCALATDHYLRLATRPLIPNQILQIMRASALVVLGCGLLDADVRHLQEMLLRRAYQGNTEPARFAIVRPPEDEPDDPYRRLEAGIWENLKQAALREMGITLLAGDSQAFLNLLSSQLALNQV